MTHSLQAEQAILTGILFQPALANEINLEPELFYRGVHQVIFKAILDCKKQNRPVSVVTLGEMIRDYQSLDQASGAIYLMDLATSFPDNFWPTAESMKFWASRVRELAGERKVQSILEDGLSESIKLPELLTQLQDASGLFEPEKKISTSEAILNAYDRIESKLISGGVTGQPTGFSKLDSHINGLEPNKLIVLAARSGNGKTAFSINIARTMVLNNKKPVLFFSLEMTAEELIERMIKLVSDTTYDQGKIRQAAETLMQHHDLLLIEDSVDLTITDIQTITQRYLAKHPDLALVIVDYIGKVKPSADSKRYQNKAYEVEGTTWGLKTIAKTHNLPVLALCQMNRGIEGRGDKTTPYLSDLKDSGAIEQDADIVMFLTSEEDNRTNPKLTIAKQRNGPLGEINFYFQGAICKFTEARHANY